jgi:hypothetical protein
MHKKETWENTTASNFHWTKIKIRNFPNDSKHKISSFTFLRSKNLVQSSTFSVKQFRAEPDIVKNSKDQQLHKLNAKSSLRLVTHQLAYKGLVQRNIQASSKAHLAFTFSGCFLINYSMWNMYCRTKHKSESVFAS